jgi:DNA-binding MarR family transcriptional regulator
VSEGGYDVSGERVVYGNVCGLDEVVAAFDELLLMPDHGAVYVALAGVVANYATGDPVWPLLVGPSGCGKSEIVTSTTSAPAVWSLSSLTPQTLLSGYERKGDKPASLLLQIGEFGVLAFKDLTTVLTMHREARGQIIGQLREVADGKTEKSFGTGLRIEWAGKLGFLAGVTPIIDEQHGFLAVMGERFLLYRMPEVPRRDIARRSLARRGHEPELRARIKATVGDFLEQFRHCGRLELPESFHEPLIVLSDIITRARSGVPRDGYSRDLLYLPEPEAPTRLAKQLAQLGAAAIAIGVNEAETWRLLRKTGWDSVPAVRCAVIYCLARQEEPIPFAAIQEETGLPAKTAERIVEDLVSLRLAKRTKDSNRWLIEQSPIAREYWADELSPETSEGVQGDGRSREEAILREVAELVDEGVLVPREQTELDLATAPLDLIRRAYGEAE